MKKIAIVADNYKLDKFKKELTAKGFVDFEIIAFTKGTEMGETSTITVNVADNKVQEVAKICQLVELHFKRGN